ncbi:MAG: DUF2752 domain-containing protein [Planctomycetes bacterium]|nr:DUF2752 domain-containing protein [Planctomycetota bacterium]
MPGKETNAGPAPRGLGTAWFWLIGSAVALCAGLTAEVSRDAATWHGVRGPHCPLRSCLGPLHCPGCGLVRSTSSALQGDFAAALDFHPAGLIVAAMLPVTLLVHFDILRRRRELPVHRRLRRAGYLLFVGAVFAGWALLYLIRS